MADGTANQKPPEEGRVGRAGWTIAIISVFAVVALIGTILPLNGIGQLRDPVFARGVITFLISISTVGIGFLLVYQAFYGIPPNDDRFRRGREVFTGLMGVLGTIVGFYFGSAQGEPPRLQLADIIVVDRQVVSHVSGGSPPYVYTLQVDGKDVGAIKQEVGRDGWIHQALNPGMTGMLVLEVSDSVDRRVAAKHRLTADTGEATTTPAAAHTATPP